MSNRCSPCRANACDVPLAHDARTKVGARPKLTRSHNESIFAWKTVVPAPGTIATAVGWTRIRTVANAVHMCNLFDQHPEISWLLPIVVIFVGSFPSWFYGDSTLGTCRTMSRLSMVHVLSVDTHHRINSVTYTIALPSQVTARIGKGGPSASIDSPSSAPNLLTAFKYRAQWPSIPSVPQL